MKGAWGLSSENLFQDLWGRAPWVSVSIKISSHHKYVRPWCKATFLKLLENTDMVSLSWMDPDLGCQI